MSRGVDERGRREGVYDLIWWLNIRIGMCEKNVQLVFGVIRYFSALRLSLAYGVRAW